MTELELIEMLCAGLPSNTSVVVGPGDDCAVLDLGLPDKFILFKTDAVVEGVHFTPNTPPEKIGHKALGRCLSDIAAMAGSPTAALVTLGLPEKFNPECIGAIYRGMNTLARRYNVAIVGGDTTLSPGRIVISVALVGWVPKTRCILRSGAKPGDAIFVTGELGGALAGKHLDFEPRLTEAHWLAANFDVHAMIDLSDGLATDLRHILKASRVGAELLAEAIPISPTARHCTTTQTSLSHPDNTTAELHPQLLAALTDGEDFELLFTVPANEAVKLSDSWKSQFPNLRLSCIGKITGTETVTIRNKYGTKPLTVHGYVHFA